MFVKICGLKTPEAVQTAVDAGADAIGFVFAESPRQVTPEEAKALVELVPRAVKRVAVMLHPSQQKLDSVLRVLGPVWIQTDASDFLDLDLNQAAKCVPVYRDGDVVPTQAGPILFEGGRSGQGELADWEQAAEIADRQELILAGGLDPDNVARAVEFVKPWGVDVSSGIESERGVKDLGLIKAFIEAARS